MEWQIRIAGALMLLLATIHISFPRYFSWKKDMANVSHINRQMMYIHTLFIAVAIFLIGLLCITSADEIEGTPFGKKISLGIGIFWALRLFVQFFGYSPKHWKGKKFETIIHAMFSMLWAYFSIIFLWAYFH